MNEVSTIASPTMFSHCACVQGQQFLLWYVTKWGGGTWSNANTYYQHAQLKAKGGYCLSHKALSSSLENSNICLTEKKDVCKYWGKWSLFFST